MYFYGLLIFLLLLTTSNTYISSQTQTPCGFFNKIAGSPTGIAPSSVAYSPLIGTNTLYAAVTNQSDNTVSVYSVNTSTGVFTQIADSPFATGAGPQSVAYSPLIGTNTLYAAVANHGENTVSVYSVNTSTGVFTQVTGSPFATGAEPFSVAFSPLIGTNTLYAAVANLTFGSVSVYSVNTSTGVFTQVTGSPFAAGTQASSVAFSPLIGANTLYAAVANFGSDSVTVYSVDTSTGIFTQVSGSPFGAGSDPVSVAFSPLIGTNTLYAAVANHGENTVSLYSVNTSTGTFTPVGTLATGQGPFSVALSPLIGTNTLYAAVANNNDSTVSVYSVNTSTGVFTEVAGSPFATGNGLFSVAFSPLIGTNKLYAAVPNAGQNTVVVFNVDLGPVAQLTAFPTTITSGQSSQLKVSFIGFGESNVQWSDGINQAGFSPITRTVSPAVTTAFSALLTDSNGCTDTSNSVTIEVESPVPPPPPPLIITASLRADPKCICPGGSSLLKLKITGGTPPFTIKWPDGKVTRTRKRTAFHKFSTSRDRNVRIRLTDKNGFSMLSNAVTIQVFPSCCRRSTKNRVMRPCLR